MIAAVPGKFVVLFEPRKGMGKGYTKENAPSSLFFILIMVIWISLAGMCICCTLDALC